jgi:hypothetical protein
MMTYVWFEKHLSVSPRLKPGQDTDVPRGGLCFENVATSSNLRSSW